MKNKFLTIIIIVLSITVGVLFTLTIKFSSNSKKVIIDDNGKEIILNKYTINESGISEPVKKVYDSVVLVKNYNEIKLQGSGSGFIYKVDKKYAYLLTNHHVIDKSTRLTITFSNKKVIEGKLLGSDALLDIAVVRVPIAEYMKPLTMSVSSENLVLGESVFAIGTPVSEEYFNSVTGGYISGLNRKVEVSSGAIQNVIQIDVAINPGNSGGPLFNIKGHVIGITSLKLVNDKIEGMGFAIPIEDALEHIDDLENGKEIVRPKLGITNTQVDDEYTLERYNIALDKKITEGVVIIEVEKKSVMDKAGFKKGDVIIKLNDEKVNSPANLKHLLYKHKIGDTLKFTYIRGKDTLTASVKLTDKLK